MALKDKSLFLYGFQVTDNNSSLDFKAASLGPTLLATLRLGYYSLTSLAQEIIRAMQTADPSNTYSVSVNRNVNGGLENRITISTSGTFLSLLFFSGPRTGSTVAPLIGFNVADYTGFTTYTNAASSGTTLVTELRGYNYISVDEMQKVFGSVNVSASGNKETIVFQIQKFWQVEFKYEPKTKTDTSWKNLNAWMIQQRLFEFTPEISSPTVFYEGTLESTGDDGKGLGITMKEMLPQYPNQYQTGNMKFRQRL